MPARQTSSWKSTKKSPQRNKKRTPLLIQTYRNTNDSDTFFYEKAAKHQWKAFFS